VRSWDFWLQTCKVSEASRYFIGRYKHESCISCSALCQYCKHIKLPFFMTNVSLSSCIYCTCFQNSTCSCRLSVASVGTFTKCLFTISLRKTKYSPILWHRQLITAIHFMLGLESFRTDNRNLGYVAIIRSTYEYVIA
jgi:hypothetical protein